jgi:hypothetical protein
MRVAILQDSFPHARSHADPQKLAACLARAGHEVELVTADQLAAAESFNRGRYWLTILPYGSCFPAAARGNFLAYLRAGGDFLSTGGYAFDRLLVREGERWVDREELLHRGVEPAALPEPINMRHGVIAYAGFYRCAHDQLGVFDAGYRLSRGTRTTAAPDQWIVPGDYSSVGRAEGWAAVGTTGRGDQGRLVPLLKVEDEFGRSRGNAGAIMVNSREPYFGSIWAYFGVETHDLFSLPGGERLLTSVVAALERGVFLHHAHSSLDCYRQGEPIEVTAEVSNFGFRARRLVASFTIESETGARVFTHELAVEVEPGETKEISAPWKCAALTDDLYLARVSLSEGDSPIDVQATGFYVWNAETLSAGPGVARSSNTLRVKGSPRFLLATNDFYPWERITGASVLDMERDFSTIADLGIGVARVLGNKGAGERFDDALVMASARHGVILLLEGLVRVTTDPAIAARGAEKAAAQAKRYRGIPGIIFDICNEPYVFPEFGNAAQDAAFNGYLGGLYRDTEALRAAWGWELREGEHLGTAETYWRGNGDIAGVEEMIGESSEWTSARARDTFRFLTHWQKGWADQAAAAIRAEDPTRLLLIGFLPWVARAVMDPVVTSDALDFVSRHWYGAVGDLPEFDANLAITDRRVRGKPTSTGGFGSTDYPILAPPHTELPPGLPMVYDTPEQQEIRFLHIPHFTLAFGGVFAGNWHFRDPLYAIFPYGLVYSDWTPKKTAAIFRALSLVFSGLRPRHVPAKVYLMLPDEARFGGGSGRIYRALLRSANGLLDARLGFQVISEWDLAWLPQQARLLVVPAPFALSPDGYRRLREFGEKGGTLYISGDFSFDESRKRTRQTRLEELAGVRFIRERYPNLDCQTAPPEQIIYANGPTYLGRPAIEFEPLADCQVIARVGSRPVAVRRALGKGAVVYSADPAEMVKGSPLAAIYQLIARRAGVLPEAVETENPRLLVFRLPLDGGGMALMILNRSDAPAQAEVKLASRRYRVAIAPHHPALLHLQGGKLVGLEAGGEVRRDGQLLVSAQEHFFLVALDGRDLAESGALALVSLRPANVTLGRGGVRAEAGEIAQRQWRRLREIPMKDGPSLVVPDELSGEIVLIAKEDQLPQARDAVVRRLSLASEDERSRA